MSVRPCTTIGGRRRRADCGFTLVEIVLALMVVSLGLLGLFQLFPSGLRASYDATVETRTAQFADEVFGGIRAEAMVLTDAKYWHPTPVGETLFKGAVEGALDSFGPGQRITANGLEHTIEYPWGQLTGSKEYLRYTLDINIADENLATARLVVRYGEKMGGAERKFYTEFYNYGSVR